MQRQNFQREIRNRLRLTQTEFAQLLGTGRVMISKAENDTKRMSLGASNIIVGLVQSLDGKVKKREAVEEKSAAEIDAQFDAYLLDALANAKLRIVLLEDSCRKKEIAIKLAACDRKMLEADNWSKSKLLKGIDDLWRRSILGKLQAVTNSSELKNLNRLRVELMQLKAFVKQYDKKVISAAPKVKSPK